MSELRSQLIRLAHQKPELRGTLLPLLGKNASTTKTAYMSLPQLFKYLETVSKFGLTWDGNQDGTKILVGHGANLHFRLFKQQGRWFLQQHSVNLRDKTVDSKWELSSLSTVAELDSLIEMNVTDLKAVGAF